MQTAMQEMIEWIVDKQFPVNKEFVEKTIELTMKEKEQIMDAYEASMERPIDNYAEAYYNMNYNQNK